MAPNQLRSQLGRMNLEKVEKGKRPFPGRRLDMPRETKIVDPSRAVVIWQRALQAFDGLLIVDIVKRR